MHGWLVVLRYVWKGGRHGLSETCARFLPSSAIAAEASQPGTRVQLTLFSLQAHSELKQFDQELLKQILGEMYDFHNDMLPIITDDANAPAFLQRPALRERQNGPVAP